MKKLLLLLSIILLSSCSKENINEDCNCTKENFQRTAYICYDPVTNLPETCYSIISVSIEDTYCRDAGTYPTQNGNYYIINCN